MPGVNLGLPKTRKVLAPDASRARSRWARFWYKFQESFDTDEDYWALVNNSNELFSRTALLILYIKPCKCAGIFEYGL